MDTNPQPPNLDRQAAQRAQAIIANAKQKVDTAGEKKPYKAEDVDNLATKALGVLQENGVFACALFLYSRTQDKEKLIAPLIRNEMLTLLSSAPFSWPEPAAGFEAELSFYANTVTDDLDKLLLAKESLEQMLIYTRYGAKAWKASV